MNQKISLNFIVCLFVYHQSIEYRSASIIIVSSIYRESLKITNRGGIFEDLFEWLSFLRLDESSDIFGRAVWI